MSKVNYYIRVLPEMRWQLEQEGWLLDSYEYDNPSGALAVAEIVPVLMVKSEDETPFFQGARQ